MMSAVPDAAQPAAPLAEAFAEPIGVAAGWVQAPPWVMVALVLLTLLLLALSHRQPGHTVQGRS